MNDSAGGLFFLGPRRVKIESLLVGRHAQKIYMGHEHWEPIFYAKSQRKLKLKQAVNLKLKFLLFIE